MADDKDELMKEIQETLSQLMEDTTVPRNIRKGAQDALNTLNDQELDLDVRAANAIYILDELANDPNIPTYGRTVIWSIISKLEALTST